MSDTAPVRVGTCSLCRESVYQRGGQPDQPEMVKRGAKHPRAPHAHKKPYTIRPVEDDGDYRYWHDFVPSFVR